LVSI
jgi:uncharacterized coiled-coil protein SlyX